MSEISRVASFGKLNSLAYKAMEGATVFCKLRGNPYVELEHWLQQLLQNEDTDLHRIVRHFDVDAARLAADMTTALDRLPRGSTSISGLSENLDTLVERGWVYASLMFGDRQIRSGYLLVGMLKTPSLRNALMAISRQFERVRPDVLTDEFTKIVAGSAEENLTARDGSGGAPGEDSGAIAPAQMGKQEALKKFTVDLTEQARSGKMDPIVGRDEEIRQVVDILMRRRQNNPILVGEAGVGKTAVVEGFAQRIARGDVPPALKDVSLLALDVGLLQAGASMKGEFEQRLRSVIDEVQASPAAARNAAAVPVPRTCPASSALASPPNWRWSTWSRRTPTSARCATSCRPASSPPCPMPSPPATSTTACRTRSTSPSNTSKARPS